MTSAIATENLNQGTTAWKATNAATTQIQAYVSACSVAPGGSLNLYVSTQSAGTSYSIAVYRLGYYQGNGARLMLSVTGQSGVAQGYYDKSNGTLNNCPTAYSDSTTHLLEARWTSSYTINVGANWVTGIYLVQLTDANGYQTYTKFTVTGSTSSDYVVVRPDNTDNAYNYWGGSSLYPSNSWNSVQASRVSWDRPDVNFSGGGGAIFYETCLIQWLESQGYDLCYLSSVDLHTNPAQLLSHKAYLSIGHDEYWSLQMRNGVEAAIASGVSAFFTSANTCYWQVRYETGGQNGANRTMTGYKVASSDGGGGEGIGNGPLSNDPYYSAGNSLGTNTLVTAQWRDPVLNRPENGMIGIMYSSYCNPPYFGWTIDSNADTWLLAGTGLTPGQSYGTDCGGYEWDKVFANGVTPDGLKIIATTAITNYSGQADTYNTTYYIAPSGALVVATGSVQLSWALAPYRYSASNVTPTPQMQAFFANVMYALKLNAAQRALSGLGFHR